MTVALPLDEMTRDEKWQVILQIYADFLRHGEPLPDEGDHAQLLRAREARIASGEAKFYDLEEVEKRLERFTK